jgi:cytochrome c
MSCEPRRPSARAKRAPACEAVIVAVVLCLYAASGAAASDFHGHGGPVMAIELSPDGDTVLTGSFDYSMIYWRIGAEGPEIVHRFDAHDGAVNDVAFVPGTRLAASGSDDGMVRLWSLETFELVHRFEGHTHKVVDIAVSPDGRLVASAGWDRTVRLWSVPDLQPAGVLEGHGNNVNAVAFSPLGDLLYSAGYDGTIRLWDPADAVFERTVLDFGWGVNEVRALPDNQRLLFGSLDGTVGVLDIETGVVERTLARHDGPVLSLLVDPASGIAASGAGDGRIHVWSLADWSKLREHENPYGPVWTMAASADGTSMYYGTLDDFAIDWQMVPGRPFDPVDSDFPRRFQVSEGVGLGERQFARKCSVCHTLTPDGANRAGPTLYGVFGRRAGTLPGYAYSDALLDSDIVWSEETIGRLFDEGPQEVLPGTKMPLQRMTDADERNALIAFLKEATRETGPEDGSAVQQ